MSNLYHQANTLADPDDILNMAACHLASILNNTNDRAKDLTIYCQASIYGSDSSLPISYLKLK